MKIIGPIVFILIAGILRSANAQLLTEQEWQLECNKYGGLQAYESVRIAATNLENTTQLRVSEILVTYVGSGIAAALTVYCEQVEDLNNAFISFTEVVKPCLEPSEREMPGLYNFTASVLQFPCANRNLVEAVHNSTDRECWNSTPQAVRDCGQEIISAFNATRFNPTRHEAACRQTQTFEQCTVRALEECEDKIFSTTLDSLYKYVNNYISCGNLTKSPIQN